MGTTTAAAPVAAAPRYMDDVMSADLEVIGKLIKQWATGQEFMNKPNPAQPGQLYSFPKPQGTDAAALEALQQQLNNAGAALDVTKHFKKLLVVQGDADTFVLKLPAAAFITLNEQLLNQQGTNYPLPTFYAKAIDANPPPPPYESSNFADRETFDCMRLGDYSISNCC